MTSSPILSILCQVTSVSTPLFKKDNIFLFGSTTKAKIVPLRSSIFTSMIFPMFLPSTVFTISLLCKSDNLIFLTLLLKDMKKRNFLFFLFGSSSYFKIFFNFLMALFSNRDTWAWLMDNSSAISICVFPITKRSSKMCCCLLFKL